MNDTYVTIGKPWIEKRSDAVFLFAHIVLPDSSDNVFYFKYPLEMTEYISYEVIDGFLLSLFPYCIRNNISIKSETPASEYLLWNLKEVLVPTLTKNIETHHNIDIDVQPSSIRFNGFAAGTGLSCGVDSFYTIFKNLNTHKDECLNIKYLCYFNAGASGSGIKGLEKYNERARLFEKVAKNLKCNFVTGETNINDLYLGNLHEKTHVYRTLGMVLNLQKLFKVYYFSSSFVFSEFKFSDFDPSFYDILSMQCLSTMSTRFVLCGAEADRIEKLKFISKYQIARDNLNVCVPDVTNCGKCNKCVRTILELYLIGELDKYKESFDVDFFLTNFRFYVRRALLDKNGVDMPPIIKELKHRKIIKLSDYLSVYLYKIKHTKIFRMLFKRKNINKNY